MSNLQKILLGVGAVAILLIVGVVLMVNTRKTRDAIRVADITTIQNMLEVGFHATARYPIVPAGDYGAVGAGEMEKLCLEKEGVVFRGAQEQCFGSALVARLPRDPQWLNRPSGVLCASDPSRPCEYAYASSSDGSNYQTIFRLEGPTGTLQCAAYPCLKALTNNGIQ